MSDLQVRAEELEIVSDVDLMRVHGSTNSGCITPREVVRYSVLKCACGWHLGSTALAICREHGLIKKRKFKLTYKGKKYLWASWVRWGA